MSEPVGQPDERALTHALRKWFSSTPKFKPANKTELVEGRLRMPPMPLSRLPSRCRRTLEPWSCRHVSHVHVRHCSGGRIGRQPRKFLTPPVPGHLTRKFEKRFLPAPREARKPTRCDSTRNRHFPVIFAVAGDHGKRCAEGQFIPLPRANNRDANQQVLGCVALSKEVTARVAYNGGVTAGWCIIAPVVACDATPLPLTGHGQTKGPSRGLVQSSR